MQYQYPCTGNIGIEGFDHFLNQNIQEPRRNINLFSAELKAAYSVPYLSLVNSGSSANLTAALALAEKLKRKGKNLVAAVSAFTFPTTMSALILAGFSIRIIDTAQDRFVLDPDELEKQIKDVSLIVPTHFLGFPADMKQIRAIADQYDCLILQDACETLHLTETETGIPFFAYGDMTTWSFYHPHHLSAYGGGAVITLNQEDAAIVDSVIHWGRKCKCHISPALCTVEAGAAHQFTYERIGLNVEISELNACFGRWQFQTFEQQESIRKQHYAVLYDNLKELDRIKVYQHPEIGGSLFVFPIRMQDGMYVNEAYHALKEKGIEIRTLMSGVSNEQEAFSFVSDQIYPNAHEMAEHTFFVGIHQTLTDSQIREMAEILGDFFS